MVTEAILKEGGHIGPPLPVGGDLCVAPLLPNFKERKNR